MTNLQESLSIGISSYAIGHAEMIFPGMRPSDALSELCKYIGPRAKRGQVMVRIIEHIVAHGGAKALISYCEQYTGDPDVRQRAVARELESLRDQITDALDNVVQ